jgi:hydrogenase maturation protein HypF
VSYEGQAAVALEAACDPAEGAAHPLPVAEAAGRLVLDARPTVTAVAADVRDGVAVGRVAARFHRALADATASACATLAGRHGVGTVVLSGGVFQNRVLLGRTTAGLREAGLRVLAPARLPANDGGIAYGQAAVAAAATARR